MADVLDIQCYDEQDPWSVGEEKNSLLSYLHCARSAVSVALCGFQLPR